jgi:hypothetical protein
MEQSLEPQQPREINPAVQAFSTQLTSYLGYLGLPKENVLVTVDQRRVVINNVPMVVGILTDDQRTKAMYISKFVAACSVGLFDAALNFIWDETVRNLRDKAARFDLDYFYDSVITDPDRRAKLRNESDLDKLDDWELIKGCLTTGLISEIGYRHLDYIRDMRNWASAAHPNQNELTGLQVTSWLETCIREVLAKEPAGPVIEIRRLLRNIRQEILSSSDVPPIAASMPLLPEELSHSLLRTIVGMYTDTRLSADPRNNIKLVAKSVWDVSSDDARYETGLKLVSLEANGETSRAKLAREFLELVDGLAYLPTDRLALEVSTVVDTLLSAHNGWNNFANEVPLARQLQRLVPANGEIPDSVANKYVKTLIMSRIGNRYGVSLASEPIYDNLINRFSDKQVFFFINLVKDPEFSSQLQFPRCASEFQGLSSKFLASVVNPKLKRVLEFIEVFPTVSLKQVRFDARFQEIMKFT